MSETKDIVLYRSKDGTISLDVQLEEETIWLSLNQLSELFERDKSVISRHLRNVYKEGELERKATVAKYATVQNEGGRSVTRDIEFYNLDAIISVNYRGFLGSSGELCVFHFLQDKAEYLTQPCSN